MNKKAEVNKHRKKAETNKHMRKVKKKDEAKVGTLRGLIKLTKELIQNIKDIKKVKGKKNKRQIKEDKLAIILTIIVVIIIGIVLWNIPATNNWIREMTAEDPLVNWMYK